MPDVTLSLGQLMLDEQNPRHRPVTTQEAALAAVLRTGPRKLLSLATDIAETGLSPIDPWIVMKREDGGGYIVLEGNRRLSAVRLLHTPELCPDAGLRRRFEAIAAGAAHRPNRIRCFEVASREDARPLLDRRHGGEMNGVGVVRWSAMQRTRNALAPAHQERTALVTLDWLDAKAVAGSNAKLTELLDEVGEDKFTTFGRLAGDPAFRQYCGFEISGDLLTVTDATENVILRLTMVLEDFAADKPLTVTQLKRKDDRKSYINTLRARMVGADQTGDEDEDDEDEPADDDNVDEGEIDDDPSSGATGSDGGGRSVGGTGATDNDTEDEDPKPPPMKLFAGASLSALSIRVRSILNEVQKIPVPRYPNSSAACIRMVIELAVHEAHEKCGWKPAQRDPKLRHYVENALRELDPTLKASRYLGLRQELNKKDSIINTVTLNAFLHDPHYMPSAPAMRTISDTYTVLLNDLNKAVAEAKDPLA